MERTEILAKLQDIVREAIDDDSIEINDSTVANDVDGWDSLAHILIVGEVKNTFGVRLTSVEMSELKNVKSLVDIIESRI